MMPLSGTQRNRCNALVLPMSVDAAGKLWIVARRGEMLMQDAQ
jgi:hypothetical protein